MNVSGHLPRIYFFVVQIKVRRMMQHLVTKTVPAICAIQPLKYPQDIRLS